MTQFETWVNSINAYNSKNKDTKYTLCELEHKDKGTGVYKLIKTTYGKNNTHEVSYHTFVNGSRIVSCGGTVADYIQAYNTYKSRVNI